MNATQFLELIQKADQLENADYLLLKKVQKNFPFFYISHALSTRFEVKNLDSIPSLTFAAVTSADRVWLKNWLYQPLATSAAAVDAMPGENEEETSNPKRKKRPVPKEDLIESIKRKEKKEIVDAKKREQIDLIKAFSKKEIKLATIKEIEANQNNENLADASTSLNEGLMSETFAKILLQQGKKAQAIEIYEKLALKFPEKRAYFADLIEKSKE
ncbi:MAG: hypothetical protein LW824_15950 [Algoriphagus sp.]|nr:hypothetical protein [Algoriphagus sp.]MCE2779079.1 hypothetical protein [Algoriphagus sp.]